MLKLQGNTIYITKGDTLDLTVNILDQDGEAYTPDPNDVIRFALKKKYTDPEPLILQTIPSGTLRLRVESDVTETLEVSKTPYVYDIQITMVDGTVDTFIDCQKLYVTEEVE